MQAKRLNLLLSAVAMSLILALTLAQRHEDRARRAAAAGAGPLTALEDATLRRVTIRRPGAAEQVLQREAGASTRWNLVQAGSGVAAEAAGVRAYTVLATTPMRSRLALEGLKPADFGLDAPALSLTLEADGGAVTLDFGAEEPLGGGRYVRVTPASGSPYLALIAAPPPALFTADAAQLTAQPATQHTAAPTPR